MKNSIRKLKFLLCSQKGETLTESIVSLLVFSILLLVVTLMINISLKITGNSTAAAKKAQEEEMNPIILSELPDGDKAEIKFSSDFPNINASHKIIFSNGYIIAFDPEEVSAP